MARPATPLAPLEGLEYGGSACRVFEPDDAMSRGDLQKRSVWICIPLDLARRREINVLAAFVAREGYLFELAVTEREKVSERTSLFLVYSFFSHSNAMTWHRSSWFCFYGVVACLFPYDSQLVRLVASNSSTTRRNGALRKGNTIDGGCILCSKGTRICSGEQLRTL